VNVGAFAETHLRLAMKKKNPAAPRLSMIKRPVAKRGVLVEPVQRVWLR
jgi:hypothetical protein